MATSWSISAIAAAAAILSISLIGCTYEKVVWSQWDQLRNLPGQATGASPTAFVNRVPGGRNNLDLPSWGIALKTFKTGDELKQRRKAVAWLKKLKAATNMPNIWIGTWDNRTTVYRGRYSDVDDDAAQNDIRQTRLIRFRGRRQFRNVAFERIDHLLRQTSDTSDATDAADLRRYFGNDLWSLQIAVYDDAYSGDHQKAAEDYVAELREAGEKAFYYHAPSGRSMITLGIFTYKQAWITPPSSPDSPAQQDVYSSTIHDLQERFPYNLLNNERITDTAPDGQTIGYQPSVLVKLK